MLEIKISPTSDVFEDHRVGVHQVLNIGTDRRPRKHVKTFVEKYDVVTVPSGERQAVRKEMTVQVERWWNSSEVASCLRVENAWDEDDTVDVVGKRKKYIPAGGSATPTQTVEHDEQTLLLDDCTHVEEETVKYGYKDPFLDLVRHSYFHIWGKHVQHIG